MAEHPNALRLRAAIDAHGRNDRRALEELFADDVAWHVAGSHAMAGDQRGRDELLGYFDAFCRPAGGTVCRVAQVILGGDGYCAGLVRVIAGHAPWAIDVLEAQAMRVDSDGRFCEYWAVADDQAAIDWFLS